MADKKPLRISDDVNDLQSIEFGTGDTIAIANGGSGETTANDALNAFLPSQAGNSGKVLQTDGSDTSWQDVTIPDGDKIAEDINQTNHGLVVGDLVRRTATDFTKAKADTQSNSEVIGICSAVEDANNFTITYSGKVTGLSSLVSGNVYFLSDATAGLLTTTEPAGISKPLFTATSATEGILHIFRGIEAVLSIIPPANVFGTEYEEAESNALSTTTSTTYVNKLTLTTASLPNAEYRVGWSFEISQDISGYLATGQVKIGAEEVAAPSMESDGDTHGNSGFVCRTLSGVQTLEINYRTSNVLATAEIRFARLEIWRTS